MRPGVHLCLWIATILAAVFDDRFDIDLRCGVPAYNSENRATLGDIHSADLNQKNAPEDSIVNLQTSFKNPN